MSRGASIEVGGASPTATFERLESEVRSYCRSWPVVFDHAAGSWLYGEGGEPFLDFFTGAGTLNYGHNNPLLKQPLIDYVTSDRVIHSLDTFTVAKREFLEAVEELLLAPRGLAYRIQFPGPAGTNAVEAALKLARKNTGRTDVVSFTGAFHGTSLGSLAVTASPLHRGAAGVPLTHARQVPFNCPGALDLVFDAGELPAAVIVETLQGEGGVNVADPLWLRAIAERCRAANIVLIVDDVQMGCGRTGPFFSFETAGIEPDIVCLSKAISGYGLPLALTMFRPELDIWAPGEHNGTFRGFDPAFVTGACALRVYWQDGRLESATRSNGERIGAALAELACAHGGAFTPRGHGLVHGLCFVQPEIAASARAHAFDLGLLVETAGPRDEVLKLLPPLTIAGDELDLGLAILGEAVVRAIAG